jgi:hypothetical protein
MTTRIKTPTGPRPRLRRALVAGLAAALVAGADCCAPLDGLDGPSSGR